MLLKILYSSAGLFLLTPLWAFAQESGSINGADTGWLLASTALVLLMTPALAFFYGGLVRSKNALNTMMMSFVALGISGTLWAIAGYSFAFGSGNAFFGDVSAILLAGVGLSPNGTIPDLLFVGFQGTFAIITAALISGAVVERMRFIPYILFIGLWGLFVYAPVCHWVWGGGWLGDLGALDFAGGAVVHVNAGIAAVVAAKVLGPRKDYGREALLPHNVPFVLLGAGLLWFGWFGFNGGSALAADGIAALALVNTLLAPAAGVFVWTLLDHITTKKVTAVGIATGIVVGLVAITPAAGFVSPGGALIVGAVGVIPSYFIIKWRTRTSLDDSLDVFAAHGMGGIMGALLTGVLATTAINSGGSDGLMYSGTFGQLGIQALSVVAVAVFSGVVTYIILKVIGLITSLRAENAEEGLGMDIVAHGEEAYATGEGAVLLNEKEAPSSVNGFNHN
ncbi:MAG: ammonium transporter [Bacteroidetes bacterium]|nr:ammonium transporter [Bacteroidota bacterium]MCY4234635.1 ammonium transporter [Bacteroidota bacterium]